jgi:hypothetical protein
LSLKPIVPWDFETFSGREILIFSTIFSQKSRNRPILKIFTKFGKIDWWWHVIF